MAGAFPVSPGPREVALRSRFAVAVSRAQSARRFSRLAGGHYWELDANWSPMTREQFAPIEAFLLSQRGEYDAFTFIHPAKKAPLGVASGAPAVSGGSQVGGTLVTGGWTASVTGILKAGDLILIAGDSKVYMVTADANSNVSGQATLAISPDLMKSPANAAGITTSNVAFTVALSDVVESRATTRGIISTFSIRMQEHIAT